MRLKRSLVRAYRRERSNRRAEKRTDDGGLAAKRRKGRKNRWDDGGQMTDGEVMSDQWMVIGDWGANRDNLNRRKAILPSR